MKRDTVSFSEEAEETMSGQQKHELQENSYLAHEVEQVDVLLVFVYVQVLNQNGSLPRLSLNAAQGPHPKSFHSRQRAPNIRPDAVKNLKF